ncbi:MAG: hypothetical protein AAEJ53_21055 [Myxococcota bacterium]
MKTFFKTRCAAVLCVVAITLAPSFAVAENQEEALTSEAGIGMAAALATLVYGPVKITYATLGLVFGGAAYGLSGGDAEVLHAVVTPAVRGDYVVRPANVTMNEDLEFIGREPAYRYSQTAMLPAEPPEDPWVD